MKIKITIIIFYLVFTGISYDGNEIDFRNLSNDDIKKEFFVASKIDGKFGITKNELKKKFGSSDSILKESRWNGGILHVYELSNKRKMKIDILDGHVMLAIIENIDGSKFLLWK